MNLHNSFIPRYIIFHIVLEFKEILAQSGYYQSNLSTQFLTF